HDMHEDHPGEWPLIRIERDYNRIVRNYVRAVSKPLSKDFKTSEEHDKAIFERVRHGGLKAMTIKCIDRLHNMLTMGGSHDKVVRKVNQTITYVLPMSVECDTLTQELMDATSEQSRKFRLSSSVYR
ncbi:MAG: hypothetical protein LR008_02085, partial [Candidatus Pacebacteria bacterium]|nr:hypothetical protein [Candidatus Paceibacterota bacterium]